MMTSATVVQHFYNVSAQTRDFDAKTYLDCRLLEYPILTEGPLRDINIAPYLVSTHGRLGGFLRENSAEVVGNRIYWDIVNPTDCRLRLGLHFRKDAQVPPGFQLTLMESGKNLTMAFIPDNSEPKNIAHCFSLEFGFDR